MNVGFHLSTKMEGYSRTQYSSSERLLKQTKNPNMIMGQCLKKFMTLFQGIMNVALWLADRNADID